MVIIGEKINSSIPASRELIERRDAPALRRLAAAQREAGADFIDINAGMFADREPEYLAFLAKALREEPGMRFSVDTPSPAAAEAALAELGAGGGHLINSVTPEKERLDGMLPLAKRYGCGVVALCMPETGSPEDMESRLGAARTLVSAITDAGLRETDIYIDPMLRPLGADETAGTEALETIRRMRAEFPGCHISVGLSNLSFGLPKRRLINRAFAAASVFAGLDAAIADPLDRELMGMFAAAEALSGRDEFGMEYIAKCRGGLIG